MAIDSSCFLKLIYEFIKRTLSEEVEEEFKDVVISIENHVDVRFENDLDI